MAKLNSDGSIRSDDGLHWIYAPSLAIWIGWNPTDKQFMNVMLHEDMERSYPEVLALASDGDARTLHRRRKSTEQNRE